MSEAVLWFITLAVIFLAVLVVAGLVYALAFTMRRIRQMIAEARAPEATMEPGMLLGWLAILVAAILIVALAGFLVSIILALTQAWQEVALVGAVGPWSPYGFTA